MLVNGSTPHQGVKLQGASQQTEILSVQDQGMMFPNCDKGEFKSLNNLQQNSRPYSRSSYALQGRWDKSYGTWYISGGKQVIKFANTGNRGRVCLFYRNERTISCKMYISSLARFTSSLFTVRTSTVATAHKKVTKITSAHILTVSSLR